MERRNWFTIELNEYAGVRAGGLKCRFVGTYFKNSLKAVDLNSTVSSYWFGVLWDID
jgi:hypothetical protein